MSSKAVVAPLLSCGGDFSASGGPFHFRLSRILRKLGIGKTANAPGHGLVEVDWVAGTVLMMSKETFNLVDGFSPSYFMYFEDVDLCWRLSNVGVKSFVDREIIVGHRGATHMTKKQLLKRSSDYKVSRNQFLGRAAAFYLKGLLPYS